MIVDIYNTKQRYDLILSDPPWNQRRGQGRKDVRPNSSGIELDYPTMELSDIQEHLRQATSLCNEDAVLFLWTIDKYLFEAQNIAENCGWKLHARMIWNKITGIPASFDIRFGHEYLLYMYRGKLRPVANSERGKIHSVFSEPVQRHSQKPEISYEIINRLYPNEKKLEMYSRLERKGWDAFGNEVIPADGLKYTEHNLFKKLFENV